MEVALESVPAEVAVAVESAPEVAVALESAPVSAEVAVALESAPVPAEVVKVAAEEEVEAKRWVQAQPSEQSHSSWLDQTHSLQQIGHFQRLDTARPSLRLLPGIGTKLCRTWPMRWFHQK